MAFVDDIAQDNASSAIITSDFQALIPEGLQITPPELYFGALVVGEDQLTRDFTVKNIGKKTLRIVSLVLQAVDQFSLIGTYPSLIKPGESFTMSVKYFSTAPGLFAGIIVITTSEDRAPYYIGLSGRVVGSLYLEEFADEFRASLAQESWARANGDEAEAGQRLVMKAELEDNIESSITQERIARVTAQEATASEIVTMNARVDGVSASLTQETNVRANADQAIITRIDVLEASTGNATDPIARAAIANEAQVRADHDSAEAQTRETMITQLANDTEAKFVTERQARVTGLAAEATARQQMAVSMHTDWNSDITAAITTEANARVTGLAAEAQARNQLAVSLRNETDQKVAAGVSTETNARVAGDQANAQAISNVQVSFGNQLASVNQTQTANYNSINDRFNASWTATLTANGLVGGFALNNNGQSVAAVFDVDSFFIGRTGANMKRPFEIVSNVVYMNEALIQKLTFNKLTDTAGTFVVQNGKLQAQYIFATNLAALSANLGNITAGALSIYGDGSGGWGYVRSDNMWWGAVQNGWVFARAPDGQSFMDMRTGPSRIWMSSWGDCGIQFPGILMTNGGLTISQLNVIGSSNIADGSVSNIWSVTGSNAVIALTINVPAGETWRVLVEANEGSSTTYQGGQGGGASHVLYAGQWNGNFQNYNFAEILETSIPVFSNNQGEIAYYNLYSPATCVTHIMYLSGPTSVQFAMQGKGGTRKSLLVTGLRK